MSEDRDVIARRRARQRRMARVGSGGEPKGFFATPLSAVVCMAIALGAVLAFWGGAPQWVLLALGIGSIVVVVIGIAFWRARRSKKF